MTATELHELLRYEDGKLFWKKDVARNVKAGQEAGTTNSSPHGAFANQGVK
jgi:hypothetical protein